MTETVETNRDWQAHWASVGRRSARDDLFGQVGRTVCGLPEPEDQIDLLIAAIARHLNLGRDDVVLDLCCGNGLLTERLSPLCRAVVGVDYSRELIEVARGRSAPANVTYLHRAADALHVADFPAGFPRKICLNAGLQYFTLPLAERLFDALKRLAAAELLLFFTEIPDAGKLDAFYNTAERRIEFERRRAARTEAMGTWWSRDHLKSIIETNGYCVDIIDPAPERASAHYRFDLRAELIR